MYKVLFAKINAHSILRSSLLIGAITVIAKLLGYFEKVALAYYLGTSYQIDVYTLVISVIMSVFLFFRELIESGFLYVFIKALNLGDKGGAWAFFNIMGRLIFVITVVLSVLVFLYADIIIGGVAPGFQGLKKALSIELIKCAFPASIFLSLSAITSIALNGQKEFVLPASGDLGLKLVILLSILFLSPQIGIYSIIYGLILGTLAKLIIHSLKLYRNYSVTKLNLNKVYAQEAWNLTWPLLIGVTFSQINDLLDNIFASYMKEGIISALSYSKKIIELPILAFPYILSVVIFPYFSQLSILKKKEKLSELLICSLAWIIIVFLPLSVFFNIFSYELVEIMFKRGAFNSYSTKITAHLLAIYSYGLIFFALETIVVVFYFANSNTKTPIVIGILCVIENILLTFVLIKTIGYTGIALGLVISKATKLIALLAFLDIKERIDFKQLRILSLKALLVSAILPFVFYFHDKVFEVNLSNGILKKFMFISLAFLVGNSVYIAGLWLLRINKRILFGCK